MEPGEAWVRGAGEPLAVFELPSVCETGVAVSNLGNQHRIIKALTLANELARTRALRLLS